MSLHKKYECETLFQRRKKNTKTKTRIMNIFQQPSHLHNLRWNEISLTVKNLPLQFLQMYTGLPSSSSKRTLHPPQCEVLPESVANILEQKGQLCMLTGLPRDFCSFMNGNSYLKEPSSGFLRVTLSMLSFITFCFTNSKSVTGNSPLMN